MSFRIEPGVRNANGAGLTRRERQVLKLMSGGMTNREIAQELFIGTSTVDTHVANVIGKLGVRTRLGAVTEARDRGLLDR
jgi:DNA-binding CsgD family transcriptional regulator